MPLTYCACVGQEEEIAQSIFVAGRKFCYWIIMKSFFPVNREKIQRRVLYVPMKTSLLVPVVVQLWLILRCTGNLQPFWRSAPCQLYRPLFLQCLIFILVALCRCIQDPDAFASDGLQPWQAWAVTVCAGTLSHGGWVQVSVEIIPFATHSWLLWLNFPFWHNRGTVLLRNDWEIN